MSYNISLHPEAKKEFDNLDGSVKKLILKQLNKLKESPQLGEELGNKAGFDLTGYRKLYVHSKRIRIVYRIYQDRLLVYIIAIGRRDDLVVYLDASKRVKGDVQDKC